MKDEGFNRVAVTGGNAKKDGYGTLDMMEVTEVLRMEVEISGMDDIMFWSER